MPIYSHPFGDGPRVSLLKICLFPTDNGLEVRLSENKLGKNDLVRSDRRRTYKSNKRTSPQVHHPTSPEILKVCSGSKQTVKGIQVITSRETTLPACIAVPSQG